VLDRAASLARLQAALMIGVVASFLVASAMAAARGSAIDADVDAIIGGAMPSVQHLSSARGHLHDLATSLAEYVLAADDGHSISRRGVGAARHALEASLSAYRSSGATPDDAALFQDVRESIDATVEQADRTIAAVEAGDRPAYHAALIDEGREARHADGAFETLIAFKASQGERLAVHALEVRRSTLRAAFALDGLAVLFAIAATAVAVVSLRRNVSALVQASDAAEQRSSELDQFAGRVAHDVLSPLMNVTLALHIVGKRLPPEDPAQRAGNEGRHAYGRADFCVSSPLARAPSPLPFLLFEGSNRRTNCSEAASSLVSAHGPSGRRAKGALPHQGHFHLSR
jgi:hypothetical protein